MIPSIFVLVALCTPAASQEAVPPGWRPVVIDACEAAGGFARLADRSDPFAACSLTVTDAARHSGHSVQWTFTPRPGAPLVGLSNAAPGLTGPGAVSLWVKNPAGDPLRMGVRLVEREGAVYESERVDLGEQKGWRELVFLTDACRLAPESADPDGALGLPPARLDIILEGAEPGKRYAVYIDEVMAHLAPREKLDVGAVSGPEAAAPGDEIQARAVVNVPAPLGRPHRMMLALVGGEVVVSEAKLQFGQRPSTWKAGEMVESAPVRLRVPQYVAGGKYAIRVRCDDLDLGGKAAEGAVLEVGGPMVGSLSVMVADHNGAPTALVNDRPLPLFAWFCGPTDTEQLRAMPPGGLPVLMLPATADHDPYGMAADVWLAPDRWDYAKLDGSVLSVLDAQPKARLLLRVFLSAPDWWEAANPNELMLFAPGRHAIEVPGIAGERTYPALSSEKWRADASEALRRFVTHVEGAPYADHVIGYLLASGEEGRWRYWGSAEGVYGDYSRPQRAAFVAWLRDKYQNDIRKLRAAWQDVINPLPPMGGPEKPEPALGWEDVKVPPLAARVNHPTQALHDPAAVPEVIDYNLCHARQVVDAIARFAAVAKSACQRRKLVGVSYGHILDHARGRDELQAGGHIALGAVLANDDLDFLAGPALPSERTEQPWVWTCLANSVRSHGKLWVDESSPGDWSPGPSAWRTMAPVLAGVGSAISTQQAPTAWPDMAPVAEASLGWDRTSVSEIAVIVDDYSLAYLAQGNTLSLPLLVLQQFEIARIGAPVDVWLLDDLIAGRAPDYKLYIFVDAFLLDQKARDTVRNHVARNGKTALWIYAPGALDEMASGRTALELTGISVGFVQKAGRLRAKIIDPSHPLLDGVPKDLEYGAEEMTGPIYFALPTKGCEPLAAIQVPSLGTNPPRTWAGLMARDFDAWTSVYSAAPDVPAPVLRSIARKAGVHLYVDTGDVVWASASLLAIQATSDGEKRIRLPGPADVRDVLTREQIATGVMEFALTMRAGETRLLYVGDPKRFGLQDAPTLTAGEELLDAVRPPCRCTARGRCALASSRSGGRPGDDRRDPRGRALRAERLPGRGLLPGAGRSGGTDELRGGGDRERAGDGLGADLLPCRPLPLRLWRSLPRLRMPWPSKRPGVAALEGCATTAEARGRSHGNLPHRSPSPCPHHGQSRGSSTRSLIRGLCRMYSAIRSYSASSRMMRSKLSGCHSRPSRPRCSLMRRAIQPLRLSRMRDNRSARPSRTVGFSITCTWSGMAV